jgi:DNA-binding HxlR family transcriptional regulator
MTPNEEATVMSDDSNERLFQLLGFNLEEGKYRVLRVILASIDEEKKSVRYDDLAKRIEEIEGKKIARQLFYRYIKALEEDGFVEVDRSRYRRHYSSNYDMILHAVEQKRTSILEELRVEHQNLTDVKESIEDISTASLARRTREILAGRKLPERARSVSGFPDVQNLIDDVVYNRAEDGDIIRITLDWVGIENLNEERRDAIRERFGYKDVTFRMLYHKTPDKDALEFLKQGMIDDKSVWHIEIRFCPRSERTYELIALNQYGVVLIMSLAPLTALWIPQAENELLVNDAIDTFDRDYEDAQTLQEMISKNVD